MVTIELPPKWFLANLFSFSFIQKLFKPVTVTVAVYSTFVIQEKD